MYLEMVIKPRDSGQIVADTELKCGVGVCPMSYCPTQRKYVHKLVSQSNHASIKEKSRKSWIVFNHVRNISNVSYPAVKSDQQTVRW